MTTATLERTSAVSKNYAQALIELGTDNKVSFETLSEDLKNVDETITSSKDLSTVLTNPSINNDVKYEIIEAIFKDKIDTEVLNFIKLLIEKDRIKEFSEIHTEFITKVNSINNIKPVTVVSAVKLDDTQKKRIVGILTDKMNKTILPHWETDKSIIAGLIVRMEDDIIDMSIRHRINKMNKSLTLTK